MVTFSIHIGIVKKCVSSNRFFFLRSFHDQNNAELRLALISTINEKLYDWRQQLIQQTSQLDHRVNKSIL